jgi:hypothetical protein
MFDLATNSKLRGCDLVRLKIGQLVLNALVRHRATVIQQKIEQPVQFELTEQLRDSLLAWLSRLGSGRDDYISPNRAKAGEHLSARQYARLVGD